MDIPIQNQSVVKNVGENSRLNNILWGFLGILFGVIVVSFIFLSLHYFNIISLSKIIPLLSFLPHRERMMQPEDKIAQVGKETLYGSDLLHQKELFKSDLTNYEQLKEAYMPNIIQESLVLQAGEKEGWIQISNDVFNTTKKDWGKRDALYKKVLAQVHSKTRHQTWNAVQVLYVASNDKPEDITRKKPLAQKELQEIKTQLTNGRLTLQQLIEEINKEKKREDGLQILANTYVSPDLGWSILAAGETVTVVENAPENQNSEIFEVKQLDRLTQQNKTIGFAIAKKMLQNETGTQDFADWYSLKKKDYAIRYF